MLEGDHLNHPEKEEDRGMWMGAVDRDMNMVGLLERWRTTEDDGKEASMTIAVTPDDGSSQTERRLTE